MKYVLIMLALAGGCYYAGTQYNFDDALAFVARHKDSAWAPRADYALGFIYHQSAQYGKSQAAFNRLLTDFPKSPLAARSLFYIEDAAEYNHDWAAAKSAAEQYVAEHQDGPDLELMRRRLELLNYHHGP